MSKSNHKTGDHCWIVEWYPASLVKRDEDGNHDMDQILSIEKREKFATEELARDRANEIIDSDLDWHGCVNYCEHEWIDSDEFGELPDGQRWEPVGEMRSIPE